MKKHSHTYSNLLNRIFNHQTSPRGKKEEKNKKYITIIIKNTAFLSPWVKTEPPNLLKRNKNTAFRSPWVKTECYGLSVFYFVPDSSNSVSGQLSSSHASAGRPFLLDHTWKLPLLPETSVFCQIWIRFEGFNLGPTQATMWLAAKLLIRQWAHLFLQNTP